MSYSFVYEDLVSQVKIIQNRTVEIENILHDRYKHSKKIPDELKLRSLTFIDPYGNPTTNKYFDHELIIHIINKYKKNYVPKYLQSWIQFGTMKDNIILPSTNCELKSTLMNYQNDNQFLTYGHVTVWVKDDTNSSSRNFQARVLLMKIKMQILEHQHFDDIELKLCRINTDTYPSEASWNEGTTLKLDDTIMSCQLYQDHYAIMASIFKEKVKNCLEFGIILFFLFSLLARI
jgi:hypothetical protein